MAPGVTYDIDWDGLWPPPAEGEDGSSYGETEAADGTPGAPNDGTIAAGGAK